MTNSTLAQTQGTPPAHAKMTMAQCDAEIRALDQIHRTAILDFWGTLKGDDKKPLSSWNPVQKDLYTLFQNQERYQRLRVAKVRAMVGAVWDRLISQFDDGIKEQLQMSPYATLALVAVDTSDGELTLVHRYKGKGIYSVAEGTLDKVPEGTGPHWYYRSYFFESEGHSRGSYNTPHLYVFGTIDPKSRQWIPKAVEESTARYYKLVEQTEVMETLIEHNKIHEWKEAPLPTFPSGVEARLSELRLLRTSMSRQATTSTPDENAAIAAAGAPFEKPIADLQSQILRLTDMLVQQKQLKIEAQLQAQLKSFGFEDGQEVTHASSGETGVLTTTGGCWPKIMIDIGGKGKPEVSRPIIQELRLGEWSRATETQGLSCEFSTERNRG